jgi:hypothetical protein
MRVVIIIHLIQITQKKQKADNEVLKLCKQQS